MHPALTVAARGIGLHCAFGCIFLVVKYRTFVESRIILYSLFWKYSSRSYWEGMDMIELKRIAVNIRHSEVDCWTFKQKHAMLLQRGMPGANVRICETDEAFVSALGDSDAALVWRFRQDWFEAAPQLRVISTPAAGKDLFTVTPPAKVLMLNGQFHGQIIGETVCGALLGMSRGILSAASEPLLGKPWPRAELSKVLRPLRGSHAVILGMGHLGTWIGRMLKSFGVRISGMRRDLSRPAPDFFGAEDRIFGIGELNAILPHADHVILALPATSETNELLNGHRINLLPRHATVVNVGRGNAIAEMPLYAALSAGRIAGAFLDVFAHEPLPADSILLHCPNLWRLPHASAISDNYLDLYVEDLLKQLHTLPA